MDKELSIIISARDEATQTLNSVSKSFGDLVSASQAASLAFAGALTLLGKNIIDTASDMEQAKVAFTTFEGSAGAASATLKQLSDFAKATPFTFPTVVEASKRLLAYNVSASDLIPTLKTLGDISSGIGTEKLPQLILAFGQVKAATHLTGMELRQFSEAGVPMLQALVDKANEGGGVLTMVGGTSAKTKAKMDALTDTLQKQNNRMDDMNKSGNKSSATYKNLNIDIDNTKEKLAALGPVTTGTMARVKVTAQDMIQMVSDGKVSFEQVQAALTGMTTKGGRFFNLMDKQSQTFAGRMSNISDEMVRVALNIAGISTKASDFGAVIKGGPFDMLSTQAQKVLDLLSALEPHVQGIIQAFVQNQAAVGAAVGILVGGLLGAAYAIATLFAPLIALMAIFGALGFAIGFLIQNWNAFYPIILGVSAALLALAAVIYGPIIGAFLASIPAAVAAGAAWVVAFLPVIAVIVAIGLVVAALAYIWQQNFFDIQGKTKEFLDFLSFAAMLLTFLLYGIMLEVQQLAASWTKQWDNIANSHKTLASVMDAFVKSTKATFDVLNGLVDVISGNWVMAFFHIHDAIDGVTNAINAMIKAAQNIGNKVSGGLKIPGFQHGGFVPGGFSDASLAVVHGGERVVPRVGTDVGGGGGSAGGGVGSLSITFTGPVNMDSDSRVKDFADKVITIIGRQNELAKKGVNFG